MMFAGAEVSRIVDKLLPQTEKDLIKAAEKLDRVLADESWINTEKLFTSTKELHLLIRKSIRYYENRGR